MYYMSTNNEKYLVLRGKNKDIYFIQKRLTKEQSDIIGKNFIKKSLETTDLTEAIIKRDEILSEIEQICTNTEIKAFNNLALFILFSLSISLKSSNDLLSGSMHKPSAFKFFKFKRYIEKKPLEQPISIK